MNIAPDERRIKSLAHSEAAYFRGEDYYRRGRVRNIEIEENEGLFAARAAVLGNGGEYAVSLGFDQNGEIRRYRCDCDAFGVWRGICKHIVAVVLKLIEMRREELIYVKSRRAAEDILRAFEKAPPPDFSAPHQAINPARITPSLCLFSYGEARLSLKVGRGRDYTVKNAERFARLCASGGAERYGKNLELVHARGRFEPDSRGLFDMLAREFARAESLNRASAASHRVTPFCGRYVTLLPHLADEFFDLFAGRVVAAAELFGKYPAAREIELAEPGPPVVTLEERGGKFILKPADRRFSFIEGEKRDYVIMGGVMRPAPKDGAGAAARVLTALRASETGIVFSGEDKERLAVRFVPALKKSGLIDASAAPSITRIAPPEMKAAAYLDAEGGVILCEAAFRYAGKEYRGAEPSIARDPGAERAFLSLLANMGFVARASETRLALTGDDAVYAFFRSENGLALLKQNADVFATGAIAGISQKSISRVALGARISGGLLEITAEPDGFPKEELAAVLESVRAKKKYHRLKDGSFLDIDGDPQLSALDELLSRAGASPGKNGEVFAARCVAPFVDGILRAHGAKADKDAEVARLAEEFANFDDESVKIPESLNGTPRRYQVTGYRWLKLLARNGFGGILADEMGLGKTLQVIALLLSERGEASIVVAPTSLIYNWEKEISRFAPPLKAVIVAGDAGRRRAVIAGSPRPDVYITTYDTLKRDIEHYAGIQFRFVIADEAQNVKNPATQNAKALKLLNGRARFALTGTPVENGLSELWSVFDFLMPGFLGTAAGFAKTYEAPIVKKGGEAAAKALSRQIAPFLMRRVKSDVLTELPPKIETTLYAEMPPEQRRLYAAHLAKARGELNDRLKSGGLAKNQIAVFALLTRLRQICCHPAVFCEDYKGGSGKLDLTMETARALASGGHRALIFSQFTKMLAIIGAEFDKAGISYYYLDGATPPKERLFMTDAFNGGERRAFLISLKAGGAGLNLAGADVVIHYDPWWNPAVMEQASGRAHRIGQDKIVQVIRVVAKNSVEEKILELQAKKRFLAESVVNADGALEKMTEDDLKELFA